MVLCEIAIDDRSIFLKKDCGFIKKKLTLNIFYSEKQTEVDSFCIINTSYNDIFIIRLHNVPRKS